MDEVNEEELQDISDTEDEPVEDEALKDMSVPLIQYDISSYGADYDVEGIFRRLERGDILIPSFQRNYVWTIQLASKFVESLLLGLPIPGVFVARERGSNKLLVIDGQQRLKTLQFFYNGVFNPSDEDDNQRVFRLTKVQKQFEGKTYQTLSSPDRTRLNDSLIHLTIVKQDSPEDDDTSIYYLFDRLNSYGRRLLPQEIRTAIDHGPFIDLVKQLNDNPDWRSVFGRRHTRLKDQEMILRFLAMNSSRTEYEAPMNEFLNKFSQQHRNADSAFLATCRDTFTTAISVIHQSIGQRAFRPQKTINAAVLDTVMVGIAERLKKGPIENLENVVKIYDDLLANPEYQRLVAQSTSNESNVKARFPLAVERFQRA